MEEVVADEAAGTRRRRAGGMVSEVADDTPGAGAGGNGAATDGRAQAGEDDPDERYLNRAWVSLMLCSAFLLWTKCRPFINPPPWLSRARGEAGAGVPRLLAGAQLYKSFGTVSASQEVSILIELCLFHLKLVFAGQARADLRRFMSVAFVSSLAAFVVAASMVGGRDADAAAVFLTVLPNAAVPVMFALRKLKELLAKVGELFCSRG